MFSYLMNRKKTKKSGYLMKTRIIDGLKGMKRKALFTLAVMLMPLFFLTFVWAKTLNVSVDGA